MDCFIWAGVWVQVHQVCEHLELQPPPPSPALSATQWHWAGPEAWGQLVSSHQGAAEAEQGLLQDGSPLSLAYEAL